MDSYLKGNLLRFVNDLEDRNCEVLYVPRKNKWVIYYVATIDIEKDRELSISYGLDYWNNKMKVARNTLDQKNLKEVIKDL